MSENPFDDESGTFYALVNGAGQYSLWPAFAPVPEGWSVTFGPGERQPCLDHIGRVWTDPRPRGGHTVGDTAAAPAGQSGA